jgi:hypothetical protein
MDRYEGPHTVLAIALHICLCLEIIVDHYEGPHTYHNLAFHGRLYLAIIMDRYEGPHTALTIDCMEDSN